MKTGCNPLIYRFFDDPKSRDHILTKCNDQEIKDHIIELYKLVEYQMATIHQQRAEIVASKHKNSWSHYDKF